MTEQERLEYARMVKALDVALPRLPPALLPLCAPAVQILAAVEATTRYTCPMCRSTVQRHTCSCPVTGARRGVRARSARRACR